MESTMTTKNYSFDYLYDETNNELNLGIGASEHYAAFPRSLINSFFSTEENPYFRDEEIRARPLDFWVSIDPTGGGKGSDLGLASFYYDRGQQVWLGGESIPSREGDNFLDSSQYISYIEEHVRRIRSNPKFRESMMVLMVENNMGEQGRNIRNALYHSAVCRPICVLNKDGFDVAELSAPTLKRELGDGGLKTDRIIKQSAYSYAKVCLMERTLRFYEDFIVVYNPKPQDSNYNPVVEFKRLIKDQMTQMSYVQRLPEAEDRGFKKIERTITAKFASCKDDAWFIAELNMIWHKLFTEDTYFKNKLTQAFTAR